MLVFWRACFLVYVFSSLLISPVAEARRSFQVDFVEQQTIAQQNCIAVGFSQYLSSEKDINPYLKITTENGDPVEGAWVLAKDSCRVYFSNIEADTTYKILIEKSLVSKNGDGLKENYETTLTTRPMEPSIGFTGSGYVLAAGLTRGLPVTTVNIDQADIDFFRIKPDKVHIFRQNFTKENHLYYHESQELKKISDLVYTGRWDLEIKKNLRTQVNIPVTHIKEISTPGLYFAIIHGAGVYDYSYSSTYFVISDLGLQARKYENALELYVQSLETGKFLNKVDIEGFDNKGNSLFTSITDKNGKCSYKGDTGKISLVTASRKNNITFLPLDTPALDLSLFSVAGRPFRPVELFVYGPRNLYRPGGIVVMDGLLRDYDGKMTESIPVQAKIFQPDGRMVHEFLWKGDKFGHFNYNYQLSTNALTGAWRIEFSSAKINLGEYNFLVAEFLPERMNLSVSNPDGQSDLIMKNQKLGIQIQGDYLYGAKASGCKTDAIVHVSPLREVFSEKWPGFEFGNYKDLLNQSFSVSSIALDKEGQGRLTMDCQWEQISSPHRISANVSLYDTGGRSVNRNRFWQIWPENVMAGVFCAAKDGMVKEHSTVEFQVITIDKAGNPVPTKGLAATLIREYREYFWEFADGEWKWKWSSRFSPVGNLSVDTTNKEPAVVSFPVEYGGYRLDITHPETGLVTSYEIWAGWQPEGTETQNLNRPDRVDLTLDKENYSPGDKVNVTIKAPEGGIGYILVESDINLKTIPVKIPPEGKTITFSVEPEWDRHNIYISAMIVHPGESKKVPLPKRAIGLVRLPLNRDSRKLSVIVQLPKEIRPDRSISVPVQVRKSDGSIPDKAFVTLAAVDMGVLNLTHFKTPDPSEYFFQGQKYSAELHDMYQKLIIPNEGAWGKQRFGGDAPTLARGGDRPATDVRIVAIYSQALKVDESGIANFSVDLPDFNGTIRLMAVAYTKESFGSTEHELTLASPLVTQLTMPRFLACGDKTSFTLSAHNMTDLSQKLSFDFTAGLPLKILSEKSQVMELAPQEKKTIFLEVQAEKGLGRSDLSCDIKGMKLREQDGKIVEISLNPSWFIETHSAYPALTDYFKTSVLPGESFAFPQKAVAGIVESTIGIQGQISSLPPINITSHVQQLFAYPYGCLEQVTSGLFPHVLLSTQIFNQLGVNTGSNEEKNKKIIVGLQRIMEKQKSNGGFSLWESNGPEDAWLSAYAGHFLVEAMQAGYDPGETAIKKLTKRLISYIRNPNTIPNGYYSRPKEYKAVTQAYASYVLARMEALTLGDARSFYQRESKNMSTALAHVQAGIALYLAGDKSMADKALKKAMETKRNKEAWIGDYGSDLRDNAMGFFLMALHYPQYPGIKKWLLDLNEKTKDKQWFSTQERNSMVMAGAALIDIETSKWKAQINADGKSRVIERNKSGQFVFANGKESKGFEIKNLGDEEFFINLSLAGFPSEKPMPLARKAWIKRRYLDMSGNVIAGGEYIAGQKMIVELQCTGEVALNNGLIVDFLPAGLEIDDPSLPDSPDISNVKINKKTIAQWHSEINIQHREYRDDRFVAAIRMGKNQWKRLYYSVRAVSPGSFLNPVPLMEDMYNPSVRAIGKVAQEKITIKR